MKKGLSVLLYLALFLVVSTAYAKDDIIGIDGSFQLGIIDLKSSVSEKSFGLGGRAGYHLRSIFFLDGEVMHFPENPSGDFGETLVLGGLRVGTIFDQIGVYAKARAGMIRFGGSDFDLRFEDKTYPAFDIGGIFEYYPRRNFFVRIDIGDCIIPFGGASYLSSTGTVHLGTTHNLLTEFGVGIRF